MVSKVEMALRVQQQEAILFEKSKTTSFDRVARQLWANLWDVANIRTADSVTITKEGLRQGLIKMRNREV